MEHFCLHRNYKCTSTIWWGLCWQNTESVSKFCMDIDMKSFVSAVVFLPPKQCSLVWITWVILVLTFSSSSLDVFTVESCLGQKTLFHMSLSSHKYWSSASFYFFPLFILPLILWSSSWNSSFFLLIFSLTAIVFIIFCPFCLHIQTTSVHLYWLVPLSQVLSLCWKYLHSLCQLSRSFTPLPIPL